MLFFWIVIGAVAYVTPWQTLQNAGQFPTAVAFEHALRTHWIVVLILGSALLALLQAFNANMVASSRLLFAMGRRGLVHTQLSYVNPRSLAPSVAVIAVGIGSSVAMLLGDAGLVPILEVGALASAMAWMAACASCYRLNPSRPARIAAAFGLSITALMVAAKLIPLIPGHFSAPEWVSLAAWLVLGIMIHRSAVPRAGTVATRTAAGSDAL
jgi:amino acid transporter